MNQVIVLWENGVELTESKTIGIDPEKIVATKTVSGACKMWYAETTDRRVKPMEYRVANYKSQIDALISGDVLDLTVYNVADGTTSTLTVQEKFIEQARDTTARINNTDTSCREVIFREGAFTQEVVYVSNALSALATAYATTTTSTTTSTTTTTAAATTTTTAAATTTTTAAATTTTTAAATTTTTSGA